MDIRGTVVSRIFGRTNSPNDWREQPRGYKIVSYEGPMNYPGTRSYLCKTFAIEKGDTDRWAIWVNRVDRV